MDFYTAPRPELNIRFKKLAKTGEKKRCLKKKKGMVWKGGRCQRSRGSGGGGMQSERKMCLRRGDRWKEGKCYKRQRNRSGRRRLRWNGRGRW